MIQMGMDMDRHWGDQLAEIGRVLVASIGDREWASHLYRFDVRGRKHLAGQYCKDAFLGFSDFLGIS